MSATRAERDGFSSLTPRGIDWESLPMKLFAKGAARAWDPFAIDLERERQDWDALDEGQRDGLLRLCSLFLAGEEAVTEDIQPFVRAMGREKRLADELYLSQFCFEEARHVIVFRRWLDAIGVLDDSRLDHHVEENEGYRRLLYEELPSAMAALDDDSGAANQVRASITYNHVIEGSLALTGYFAINRVCHRRGLFPGLREIVADVSADERRHMAWGTYTCRRHVAADEELWQVAGERLAELVPLVKMTVRHAVGALDAYGESDDSADETGYTEYASHRALRRLDVISSARGSRATDLDRDQTPSRLEDEFGEEDARALAG